MLNILFFYDIFYVSVISCSILLLLLSIAVNNYFKLLIFMELIQINIISFLIAVGFIYNNPFIAVYAVYIMIIGCCSFITGILL